MEKGNDTSSTPDLSQAEWWSRIRKIDILLVLCIVVMLLWPWLFFGVVWYQDGIQMSDGLAKFVGDHPARTNFFVTFLGTAVRVVVGYLFSNAILRFCQEWMTDHHLNIFQISIMSGFRNQKIPWAIEDRRYLLASSNHLRVLLVAICWGIFLVIPSTTTSLLGPVPFTRTEPLAGSQVDFSSNATDCIYWLENNTIPDVCDWQAIGGKNYSTCFGGGAQEVDLLQHGRDYMLLLMDSFQLVDFSRLSVSNDLYVIGPIRGVLPISPNDPAFATLESPASSDPQLFARMLSYNYTLNHQGLTSKVTCEYASQSPINAYSVPGDMTNLLVMYTGTCNGEADVLPNGTQYVTMNSNNDLVFWACKSPPTAQELSYFVYLQGFGDYATSVGNITCTISPIQLAIFSVKYLSTMDIFSISEPVTVAAPAFSNFIDQSMMALGVLVQDVQSLHSNLIVESIIAYGVTYFNLSETEQNPGYLQLYEALIQGVVEHLATYSRLIISSGPDPPDSCARTMNGTFTYSVMGWSVTVEHIGFLMPLTIVNIASLVIMILAILRTKSGSYEADPLHPKTLTLAEHHLTEGEPTGWEDWLTYRERPTGYLLLDPENKKELESTSFQ